MRFIPVDKMKRLREASKNGDERAKRILIMQMNGKEDFSSLLDEYFKPEENSMLENKPDVLEKTNNLKENVNSQNDKLEIFLKENAITKDSPDYQSFVDEFLKENPDYQLKETCKDETCFLDNLINDELEAITGYETAIMEIINSEEYTETNKTGIIAKLQEIKNDEIEHLTELRRMKSSLKQKEEKEQEQGIIE